MSGPRFPHLPAEAWELFLTDELQEPSRLSLERHLDDCAACRARLEERDPSRLFRRLRGLPVRDEVFQGFLEGIREQIRSGGPRRASGPRQAAPHSASRPRERFGLLLGAACVLALVLGLRQAGTPTEAGSAGLWRPEPCARVAHLNLSRDECRVLFGEARFDGEPPVFVVSSATDLGELL